MIEAPASKSFRVGQALPQKVRVSPLVWLNAVCLDAPLVAVTWLWLFARTFDTPVANGGSAALFLTAWLIYLADRFGDSRSVDLRRATSFRQRFCIKHRRAWLTTIAVVAFADAVVIGAQLESSTLRLGAAVGVLALAYLLTNRLRASVWRCVPAKEIAIGVLFAAGVVVPIASHLSSAAVLPWVLFAALCTFNCISIAAWERWLDEAQQRVSIATAFPRVSGLVIPALVLLIVASSVCARNVDGAQPIYLCVGVSAALFAFTHLLRRRVQPDARTALADLVLLTPAVLLLF
jgi:hypothetical protein